MNDGSGLTEQEFSALRQLIHSETGIWLADHKRTMLAARLNPRLRELSLTSFSQYLQRLKAADPKREELRCAINRVTTNKTSFFRENAHFDFLGRYAGESRGRGGMRVWCAASSTGEEPYSIAITLAEALGLNTGWKVLASDIDTDVLATAARAIYQQQQVEAVPTPLRNKYFLKGKKGEFEGLVKVRRELRSRIEFRRVNLIGEPWPQERDFDAVFCRNVLIYFNRETQEQVVRRLLARVAPGGYLFLGHSENLHWMSGEVVAAAHTVYQPRPKGPVV
jgi:chemotaxis protein methyltransferase CheR